MFSKKRHCIQHFACSFCDISTCYCRLKICSLSACLYFVFSKLRLKSLEFYASVHCITSAYFSPTFYTTLNNLILYGSSFLASSDQCQIFESYTIVSKKCSIIKIISFLRRFQIM